jgi:hypothetical protein
MKAVEQDRARRWPSAKAMGEALGWNTVPRKRPKPVQASKPAAATSLPAKPAARPPQSGTIPSKPLASLAASFLSQSGGLTSPAKPTLWDKVRKVFDQVVQFLGSLGSLSWRPKFVWRDYIWVVVFCLLSVLVNWLLVDGYSIGTWGYWGEILGSVLSPLPFLLSAVFTQKPGAAGGPALLAGFMNSGIGGHAFLVAISLELPFLVTRYRVKNYLILFVAALIYGVGSYILFGQAGNTFLAFDNIIKTWIVAFVSPLFATLVGHFAHRL